MRKRVLICIAAVILVVAIIVFIGVIGVSAYIGRTVNFEEDERLFNAAKSDTLTRFYANAGEYGEEYTPIEISAITMGENLKSYYSLEEISECLTRGIVAVEDKEFYDHTGVNFRRTVMAALNQIIKVKDSFGASTITQQVIKNISGDNEHTVKRKLSEIFRAIRIEESYSKDEILELYLNILPLGDNVIGVGMGALHYFGKEPSELSPEEAAVLIALANAPSLYSPYKNPDKCIAKRDIVLRVMAEEDVISTEEYESAVKTEIAVLPRDSGGGTVYSWFVETVIAEASHDYAKAHGVSEQAARLILLASGYSIYTTQNLYVQSELDRYFQNLDNFPDEVKQGLDFSMVISDSQTADLLAIVGSVGSKQANLITNHATVPHTPASTLKPLALYAPLIDSGEISWSTVFDDVPLEFIDGTRPYPANSPNVYNGLTTVKDAICTSKNTIAMRLYQMLGAERIYNSLTNNFGFNIVRSEYNSKGDKITDLAPAPLALGQLSRGVSLRELTEAYTVFPLEGALSEGRCYTRIVDSSGEIVLEKELKSKQVYKSETAAIMNQLLMNVTDHGTAKTITLGNFIDTAGKTGTSSGNLEKLFVGYTPYLTAGIRVSYNDSKTAVGALEKTHLEIWDEIMMKMHEGILDKYNESSKGFSVAGLEYLPYCKDSGQLFSESCLLDPRGSRVEYGYFTDGNKPREFCNTHVEVYYDIETEGIAHEGCPSDSVSKIALIDVPWRTFPVEVIVADAEYVYRRVDDDTPLGNSFDVPYFQNALLPDVYVGRGAKRKQFNHACYLHD